MVAERRFSTPENYAYLALLFSLLRPELQGYLKLGQDTAIEQAIASVTNPYNLTGLAFSGTLPYQSDGINLNNLINSKEAIANSGYQDPLSQYLNWQSNAQFNNSGTAMILADTQVRSQLGSLGSESGYSSDEARSPLSTSSFGSNSIPLDDLSDLGATGYTPTTRPDDYVHSLEDYVDLEALANVEPTKGNFDFNQDLPVALKQEPDYFLDKLFSPETFSPEYKTSPDGSGFSDDFSLGLESKDFDQFFDFDQTTTNNSFQYPLGNDLESVIDFDGLDSLDFNLPPDVLTTTEVVDSSNNIQSQLQDLIQNPVPMRNGSGSYPNGLTSVTVPDNSRKPVNIPTKSTVTLSNKQKLAVSSKKTSATAKKLTATKSKSMKSPNFVDMSDDDIIEMQVSEINVFIESLNEEQARYVRDVRRRGKNKEAARVCRKRKIEAIDDLEEDLKKIKLEKQTILDEQRAILEETAALKSKIKELETSVLSSLQDELGNPLSRNKYSLLQASNGTVYLGKNIDDNTKKQKEST